MNQNLVNGRVVLIEEDIPGQALDESLKRERRRGKDEPAVRWPNEEAVEIVALSPIVESTRLRMPNPRFGK